MSVHLATRLLDKKKLKQSDDIENSPIKVVIWNRLVCENY